MSEPPPGLDRPERPVRKNEPPGPVLRKALLIMRMKHLILRAADRWRADPQAIGNTVILVITLNVFVVIAAVTAGLTENLMVVWLAVAAAVLDFLFALLLMIPAGMALLDKKKQR